MQQYTGELEISELSSDVYSKLGKEKSVVYKDAQDGYDYNKGRFSFKTFSLVGKEKEFIIQQHQEGKYETLYSHIKINLKGLPFKISKIEIDNEQVTFENVGFIQENYIIIQKDFTELHFIG